MYPKPRWPTTVADYNEHAARGEDPEFGKLPPFVQPLVPPLGAIDLGMERGAIYATFTLGGLHTDVDGRVLAADGARGARPVRGRTASASLAAGGYVSGISLGDGTFFGRRAGAAIDAQIPRVSREAHDAERKIARDGLRAHGGEVVDEAQVDAGLRVSFLQVSDRHDRDREHTFVGDPLALGVRPRGERRGSNRYSYNRHARIVSTHDCGAIWTRRASVAKRSCNSCRWSASFAQTATRGQSRGNQ